MKVSLNPGWEAKFSTIKPRVYLLGNNNWQLVDDTFNKIHKQGRLKFTTNPKSFNFSVFVIWKINVESKKKVRIIVDTCKFKKLMLLNSYPLLLYLKIVANVQGYTNLAILEAVSFFYQWLLHLDHCFIFIVITYCRQEIF